MKKITVITLLSLFLMGGPLTSQTLESQVSTLDQEIAQLDAQKAALLRQVEDLKLQMIRRDLAIIKLDLGGWLRAPSHLALIGTKGKTFRTIFNNHGRDAARTVITRSHHRNVQIRMPGP